MKTINAHVNQMLSDELTLSNGDGLVITCTYSKSRKFVVARSAVQTDWIDVEADKFEESDVSPREAVEELARTVPGDMDFVDDKFSVINSDNELFVLVWVENGNGCCLDVIR